MRDMLKTDFSGKCLAVWTYNLLTVKILRYKKSVKPSTLALWKTITCEAVESGRPNGNFRAAGLPSGMHHRPCDTNRRLWVGCGQWSSACKFTLTRAKQSLVPATGACTNGGCVRCCSRRPPLLGQRNATGRFPVTCRKRSANPS